jgi:hypothetical protein
VVGRQDRSISVSTGVLSQPIRHIVLIVDANRQA